MRRNASWCYSGGASPATGLEALTDPNPKQGGGRTLRMTVLPWISGRALSFEMVGPDGTRYPNHSVFKEITPPSRLVFDHGDGQRVWFEATVTLQETASGTLVTLRQLYPSREARDDVVNKYGAIEGGKQHLAKLEAYIGRPVMNVASTSYSNWCSAPAKRGANRLLGRLSNTSCPVEEHLHPCFLLLDVIPRPGGVGVKRGTVGHLDHQSIAGTTIAPFMGPNMDALERRQRPYECPTWKNGGPRRVRECRARRIESHPRTEPGDRGEQEEHAQRDSPR